MRGKAQHQPVMVIIITMAMSAAVPATAGAYDTFLEVHNKTSHDADVLVDGLWSCHAPAGPIRGFFCHFHSSCSDSDKPSVSFPNQACIVVTLTQPAPHTVTVTWQGQTFTGTPQFEYHPGDPEWEDVPMYNAGCTLMNLRDGPKLTCN